MGLAPGSTAQGDDLVIAVHGEHPLIQRADGEHHRFPGLGSVWGVAAIDWASPFAKELLTYKKGFISGGRIGAFSVQ